MTEIPKRRAHVLVAVYWPLGGIRTYLKYVYRHFPPDVDLTVLAASTQEDSALRADMSALGIRLIIDHGKRRWFFLRILRELLRGRYDVIQSHGFITASHAYAANLLRLRRLPHVLTVHGILEDRLLSGLAGRIKKQLLGWVVNHVDVVYAVGQDMMTHLADELPGFGVSRARKVVIKNGIDVGPFSNLALLRGRFRTGQHIADDIFLIGFLGRFMEAKGFNYLIDAIDILERDRVLPDRVKVLAVGSGDYLGRYKKDIRQRKLENRFIFLPFQSDILPIYADLDAVAMPSISEAASLLALESLCAGVPLIASDCIGLRESVRDTPAIVFEARNAAALASAIADVVNHPRRETFEAFRGEATTRFNVRNTSDQLTHLLQEVAA
jgi:glycosyltransferase involved in cell wall biosynthesis